MKTSPVGDAASVGDTQDKRGFPAKYAVMAVLLFSATLSVGSWLYYARLQRRPLALWGSDYANVLLHGTKLEAMQLALATEEAIQAETIRSGERTWQVVATRDVTSQPGFLYVRHSLINDRGFDWTEPIDPRQAQWSHAIRATLGEKRATLLVDVDSGSVQLVETSAAASIRPVVKGFRQLLDEQFREAKPKR